MLILDKVKTDLVLPQIEDVKVLCSGELSRSCSLDMGNGMWEEERWFGIEATKSFRYRQVHFSVLGINESHDLREICRALEMMKTKFASFVFFLHSCFQ